jgi:hypothetical protein
LGRNRYSPQQQEIKTELTALRQETVQNSRMFKSLYESLINGLITAYEYSEMREGYEAKTQGNLSRVVELERQQAEFTRQVAEYCELSDLIANADSSGITAVLIDRLIKRIRIFSDRSIEVDFNFTNGFDLIHEVTV